MERRSLRHLRHRSWRSGGALVVLLSVIGLAAAACSSSATSGSSNATSGSSSSATAANTSGAAASGLAKAQEVLASVESPSTVTFPAPDTPVNPGGHKVAVIATGLGNAGASTMAPYVTQAIKAIGWTSPPVYDGKFTTSTQAQDIADALNAGAQALFLIGITPATVQSALAPALSKKMPIICLNCGGPSDAGNLPGVEYVEDSTSLAGQLQAAEVTVLSGGHGTVALFNDPEFPQVADRYNAALAALKIYCPKCSIITQDITIAQTLAPGAPQFTGFLTAHPAGTIDYIITPYDAASAVWAQAAAQAGRTDIKFVGYGALPPFYGYIAAGSPSGAAASVAPPLPYYGWAGVDEAARVFDHLPTWSAIDLPDAVVTHSNASTFAAFAKANGGVASFAPSNFESKFKQLWGSPVAS